MQVQEQVENATDSRMVTNESTQMEENEQVATATGESLEESLCASIRKLVILNLNL